MRYQNVCLESIGYLLPQEIWTTDDVEQKLAPLYERLKLPEGRLELMTGISERRFWDRGVMPGRLSVESCRLAIEAADVDVSQIGCLIHGSVCRDFLEPATACSVHHKVGLAADCMIYDVSNACLGILSGMIQAANMIELGQIKAALIVGSEGGRQLVENTIRTLNEDRSLTRKSIKNAIASLTIGSASCAVLLTHESISQSKNRLVGAAVRASTQHHELCQSHEDQVGASMAPLMETDSEALMKAGVATGVDTLAPFLAATQWQVSDLDRTVCHQVGTAHQKMMLESLSIDSNIDYATFSWLGNTGSAALPSALAVACEKEFIQPGHKVGLLGIGSGINCTMMGVEWNESRIKSKVAF
ncbi:3-oxoacyl-ACP synthase III [Mariniblastus fucicola]|uniref:3-oxoacyl-[acyl-carrier-protein] synthase 3 n=1 Tax=Mariniblastus fucicola TaxID=980251 RepID=A0A5B9PJ79_9BACT|nr:3-oxoacyl-ACP synthase III [Mariniblastus fucicola]QEG22741.1 3-oxoacyl-[acyl-carrier-protein] synthase 3 [Mariniblastus fucicola]